MGSFKKLNTKLFSKPEAELTPDNIYWKKLNPPVLIKEFGPIDFIDFSPVEPYYFAVTCSVRVQVYNPITKLVVKNLSRFRENAYGASFRGGDGKLICSGGEEKNVKLFDVSSKTLLRLFKGHKAAIHRTFFTQDNIHIASFSDDKTVKVWDVPTEKYIYSFQKHEDYVRAGAVSPVSSEIILSGGYDNKVKMYDTRSNSVVFDVDHGAPVESLLFLPSGGIFLSAGGTEIRVWDAFAGGRLLTRMSHHHKTITCLRLAQNGKRLLSGSLDRHVKIYDITTYKNVHTLNYPNSLLSLAVSKNDDTIVAGMVDGLVSISRRIENKNDESNIDESKRKVHYKYLSSSHIPAVVDTTIDSREKDKFARHDQLLRKFQYSKALDLVFKPYYVNKTPEVTVAVMQELIRRKGLHAAFAGRETKSILQILRFFFKYIGDYRFTRVLIDVINIFIDVYEDTLYGQPTDVQKMFFKLTERLEEETILNEKLAELDGSLEMLLAAANVNNFNDNVKLNDRSQVIIPSENAKKNFVISLS